MNEDTKISWLDRETSLFPYVTCNRGAPVTFRYILFTAFGMQHPYKYGASEEATDIETICTLRYNSGLDDNEQRLLKNTLQCFTPHALFYNKSKGSEPATYTGLMQLDFDDLEAGEIPGIRQAIFSLPFVAYVGLSVRGKGLFALIEIAEPEKLEQYAEHLFHVFAFYGIKPDTSKGRNYNDLRFVSYDASGLYREHPEPLLVKQFHTTSKKQAKPVSPCGSPDGLVRWGRNQVAQAQVGNRFETVRRVAYCLGGYNTGLEEIERTITECSQYSGQETKYLTHAREGFAAGQQKPLHHA